jgi:hypothetical protein
VGIVRRARLEVVLIGLLGVALVALLLVRPGGVDRGPRAPAPAALPQASPCGPALRDLREVAPPAGGDVASVAAVVEELRDLRFREVPEPTYLAPGALARRIAEELAAWEEDAEVDGRILELLGAVPEGYDLLAELRDLTAEQVLGFYDPSSGELVIRRDAEDGDLRPDEVLTLAHELAHALADQAVGFPDLEALAEEDPEAAAAARALLEGDAMILSHLYASSALSLSDRLSLALQLPGLEPPEDVPHFIMRGVMFPYTEGLAFACALYREEGWRGVDRAYADPPETTAQVLFPERYLAGEGSAEPAEPAGLPAPWAAGSPRPLGAADLLFLFEAPGGDPGRALEDPDGRAAGWDGGAVHVWTSGEDLAVAVLLVEREGEPELCSAVATWYRRAFQARWEPGTGDARIASHGARGAALRCDDGEVRLGIGPDVAVATRATE